MRTTRSHLQWSLASATFVALVAFAYSPTLGCLGECVVDLGAVHGERLARFEIVDVRLNAWILAWTQHALATDPTGLFDSNAFYPAERALAGSEHMLGLALLAWPLRLFTSDAVAIYQLAVVGSALLLALTTYALVRWLAGSHVAALAAGAASVFMPWRTAELTHLQLLAAYGFPLAWLLALQALQAPTRQPDRRRLAVLAVVVGLQLLTSYYLAYLLTLSLAVIVAVAIVLRAADVRRVLRLGAWLVAPYALFALLSWPYVARGARGELVMHGDPDPTRMVVGPDDLVRLWAFLAPRLEAFWSGTAGAPVDYHVPLSVFVFALASLAVAAGAGRVGALRSHLPRARIAVVALWTCVLAALVLAAGYQLRVGDTVVALPGYWASLVVPGLASFRAPHRWGILVGLAMPVLAGVGLAATLVVVGRVRGGTILLLIVFALTVPWRRLPAASIWDETLRAPAAYHELARLEPAPVVEIPWHVHPLARVLADSSYLLASTIHWRPILNGVTGYAPPTYALLNSVASALPAGTALSTLQRLAAPRWIVVHVAGAPARERIWLDAATTLGLRTVHRDERALILEVPRAEDAGAWLAAMRSSQPRPATLGGVAKVALDSATDGSPIGRLVAAAAPELNASLVHVLEVEVVNDGDRPWPGLDWQREGAVHVRYTFADGDGRTVAGGLVPLYRDVRAGERMRAPIAITPPPAAGDYDLCLDLVQPSGDGVRRLAVVAVMVPVHVHGEHHGELDVDLGGRLRRAGTAADWTSPCVATGLH